MVAGTDKVREETDDDNNNPEETMEVATITGTEAQTFLNEVIRSQLQQWFAEPSTNSSMWGWSMHRHQVLTVILF